MQSLFKSVINTFISDKIFSDEGKISSKILEDGIQNQIPEISTKFESLIKNSYTDDSSIFLTKVKETNPSLTSFLAYLVKYSMFLLDNDDTLTIQNLPNLATSYFSQ